MEFEWDPQKAARNWQKHKVHFSEAATVFADPLSVTVVDPDHSAEEDRFIIIGRNYLPKNRFIKTTKDTKAAQRARRMIFYPFVSFVSTLCPLW